jgi:beta-lactamase class A
LIHDLHNTDYSWGISQGLPEGTNIAHKIGVIKAMGVNDDVAIVFGQEDFVLCVMSETFDEALARANIGEVSRMIYDYVECFGAGSPSN